jgi:phage gp36-like protein
VKLCSKEDLDRALGGANQTIQLLDKDKDGEPDLALVDQVLEAASGEISSYLINVDLDTITEPYSSALVAKTANIAAYYAWKYGAMGQGMPDLVKMDRDGAVAWAQDVGKKLATLGDRKNRPSLEETVGVVDHDELGEKVSVTGFMKGFR